MAKKQRRQKVGTSKKGMGNVGVPSMDKSGVEYGKYRVKKKWTVHDLCSFRPLTDRQHDSVKAFSTGKHLALLGSAGTGKTFLGTYLASTLMVDDDSQIDKIIILRTAVQARDQGFVKGDPSEKMDPYTLPYRHAFTKIFGHTNSFHDLVAAQKLVFDSTSFLRSVTFDNAVVIFDEAQNAEFREINTVITRLGRGSRLILIGDSLQDDLSRNEESGLPKFRSIVGRHLPSDFHITTFTSEDIVRSDLVKRWVIGCEKYEEYEESKTVLEHLPEDISSFGTPPSYGIPLECWWRSCTLSKHRD